MQRKLFAAAAVTAVALVPVSSAGAGEAVMPKLYKNCKSLNAKYPHGLGKAKAVDKTSSGGPVTNFARSTRLYLKAMSFNKGLDRDKDGIACEKA
jgi:hypothetical protein